MSEDVTEGEFCDDFSAGTQPDEHFSQEQRDEILEAFTFYDKDGDGLISTREIATVMRSLGQVPTLCEETDMIAEFAMEQCNEITFKAFRNLMKKRMKDVNDDYELRESFKRFDKEEKGKIKVNWLRLMLTTIGEPLTNKEVDTWLGDAEEFIEDGFGCNSIIHGSKSSQEEDSQEADGENKDDTLDEYRLSEKDKSYFCPAFTLLDRDGDGIISPRTMENIIKALGRESNKKNMDEIMAYCSIKGNDNKPGMDFNGFYQYLASQLMDTDNMSELKDALEEFSPISLVDGSIISGLTDLTTLRYNLKHKGMNLTDEEIDCLWEEENNWMLEEKHISTTHLIKKLMENF